MDRKQEKPRNFEFNSKIHPKTLPRRTDPHNFVLQLYTRDINSYHPIINSHKKEPETYFPTLNKKVSTQIMKSENENF